MINTFFFNLNAIKSGQQPPGRCAALQAAKVGLLGAGMMGAGIAYAQASRGIATVLKDVSQEKAETGKAYSAKLTQKRVAQGPHERRDAARPVLARIQPTGQRSRPERLRPDH